MIGAPGLEYMGATAHREWLVSFFIGYPAGKGWFSYIPTGFIVIVRSYFCGNAL